MAVNSEVAALPIAESYLVVYMLDTYTPFGKRCIQAAALTLLMLCFRVQIL